MCSLVNSSALGLTSVAEANLEEAAIDGFVLTIDTLLLKVFNFNNLQVKPSMFHAWLAQTITTKIFWQTKSVLVTRSGSTLASL